MYEDNNVIYCFTFVILVFEKAVRAIKKTGEADWSEKPIETIIFIMKQPVIICQQFEQMLVEQFCLFNFLFLNFY